MTEYSADDLEEILHETEVLIAASITQHDRSIQEYVVYLRSYIQFLRNIDKTTYELSSIYNPDEMREPAEFMILRAPLDEMPLRINSQDIKERAIVLWRLKNAR